ncbi:hypothetical protein [Thalassovita sp.]|uniref:hypothetical protein n=1 Tax=Thalassovita sp. TaxID=1979401 RepID=UPI0029DE719E|nr:hypothetical protein [Thalassovita sp.]
MTAIDLMAAANAPAAKTAPKSPDALLFVLALLAVVAWGASVFFFGIPGLYIPALVVVPVMWIVLLIISRG